MTEFPDPVTPEEKGILSELKRLRKRLEAVEAFAQEAIDNGCANWKYSDHMLLNFRKLQERLEKTP